MGKKVLNKKLILTADFKGLTLEERLSKEANMAKAQAANAGIVAGLNPTATAVQTQITELTDPLTGLIHQRGVLKAQEEALTIQINKAEKAIRDIILDQWMPQTQTALTATPALALTSESYAALLLFGIKGQTGGTAATGNSAMDKAEESAPVIVRIETNIKGQHTIHVHNNITGKIGHPKDVARVDIYGQTGGTAPANLAALIANGGGWLGTAKRGKYVNPLTVNATTQGKPEYYIAVYIDKETKKPAAQSNEESAAIE